MLMVEDLIGKIIHSDCLSLMKQLPDKCINLILTDPPYGIGDKMVVGGTWANKSIFKNNTNRDELLSEEHIYQMLRVSKNQIIFGGNFYRLPASRCWLAWVKTNAPPTMGDFELAWTSFNSPPKAFKGANGNGTGQARVHSSEKPVSLAKWILKKYATPGQIVFDPCSGSGSFLVAAQQMGHPWLACELIQEYVEMARSRIASETAQLSMFTAR